MTAFGIAGRTALVTGASGGLGLHAARLLARHGARVTLAARRQDALAEACAALAAAGAAAHPATLDVSDATSVAALFAAHPAGFDIVVNNAGISHPARALDLTEAAWDQTLDTNLKGAFLVAQAAARARQAGEAQGRGCTIINIASILAHRVAGNLAAYAASKAGLVQLTRSLALEWARFGIRVNALCPGYIETDLNRAFFATPAGTALIARIPQRRLGHPDDLDGPLLLLASDASRYITGTTLPIDGGHLVSSL